MVSIPLRLISTLTPIVFAMVMPGCATVVNRHETLSLDSYPRGAAVYADEKDYAPIGWTPLWIQERKRWKQRYWLQLNGGPKQPLEVSCSIDYWNSILGNSLFWFAGPVGGLSALAVDGVTGFGFTCRNENLPIALKSDGNDESYCRTFIVVPPHYDDEIISNDIAHQWIRHFKQQAQVPCDEIVDFEEGKRIFAYLNIDHATDHEGRTLGWVRTRYLGTTADASHAVFLEENGKSKGQITARFYDLHRQEIDSNISSEDMEISKSTVKAIRKRNMASFLSRHVHLLPNTINFGGSAVDHRFLNKRFEQGDIGVYKVKRKDGINELLSSGFGATHVDHPDNFELWDYDYDLAPSFAAKYGEWKFVVDPNPGNLRNENEDLTVSIGFVGAFYKARLSIHTPVGALGVGFGPGVAAVRTNTNPGVRKVSLTGAYLTTADYTAFISQDIVFTLGTQQFVFSDLPSSPLFKMYRWNEVYISLGLFYPDGRSYARRIIK